MRPGFDPWVGRSPGEWKDYLLQYTGLGNSTDFVVHGVAKSQTRLSNFHFIIDNCRVTLFSKKIFLAVPHGMRDLSSLTRDQTHGPEVEVQSPNHWAAYEVPE